MEFSNVVMWAGFMLAAYSVVGNDVIQTLGTFLTSNEKRLPWYVLWLYASVILSAVLVIGYLQNDISYGRLAKFEPPEHYDWYYLLPPIILLLITRIGIPVSTTFMILTLFSLSKVPTEASELVGSVFNKDQVLGGMVQKSIMGYLIAFILGLSIYSAVSRSVEKRFIESTPDRNRYLLWTVLQWFSTGWLWSQWLVQDLANIYIYLNAGKQLNHSDFLTSLFVILSLLGFIFYTKGGAIQDVVRKKTNTADIRSATIIDFLYGLVLYVFKDDYFGLWGGKLPMSTTWVFVGLLAGREIAIRFMLAGRVSKKIQRMVFADLGKIFLGLVISILLVYFIKILGS
jgi:phosphate/sulfate permease